MKRVKLDEYVAERIAPDAIVVEAGGREFTIPPVLAWSDEALSALGVDTVKCARLVLGDEYDAWTAAGGTAGIFVKLVRDRDELPEGESPAS